MIFFVLILGARSRNPFKSQRSLHQQLGSNVSCTPLNLSQLYLYLVVLFTFVFKLFKQLLCCNLMIVVTYM